MLARVMGVHLNYRDCEVGSLIWGLDQPSGTQVIRVGPGPSGLSQYCWASSPSYSLGIVEVVADRVRWLLRVVLVSVLEDGRLLL